MTITFANLRAMYANALRDARFANKATTARYGGHDPLLRWEAWHEVQQGISWGIAYDVAHDQQAHPSDIAAWRAVGERMHEVTRQRQQSIRRATRTDA